MTLNCTLARTRGRWGTRGKKAQRGEMSSRQKSKSHWENPVAVILIIFLTGNDRSLQWGKTLHQDWKKKKKFFKFLEGIEYKERNFSFKYFLKSPWQLEGIENRMLLNQRALASNLICPFINSMTSQKEVAFPPVSTSVRPGVIVQISQGWLRVLGGLAGTY